MLRQGRLHLGQRDIASLGNEAKDEVRMGLGLGRSLIAAGLARNRPAMPKRQLTPANRRRHPYAKAASHCPAAHPALNRLYYAVPQVLRQ